jgi:molecular chaperone Hsp33
MEEPSVGVVVRALVADRAVRLLLVEAGAIAEHTRRVHGLAPHAARVAAEAVVAAALSSAQIKGAERLTLLVQGHAPRFAAHVDLDGNGALRARLGPADVQLEDGRFSGLLVAVKHGPRGELYRGATAVDQDTMAGALGAHFGSSTQSDAILRLGCTWDDQGGIASAGGLLLERLPVEQGLPSITREDFAERYGWVRDADLSQLLVQAAFGALGHERFDLLDRAEIRWECRCTPARIEGMLAGLGPAELQSMIDEDHGAEVTCHFCARVYHLDEGQLRALLARGAPPAGDDTGETGES